MGEFSQFLTSDMRLFIPLIISWVALFIVGAKVYIDDLRNMKVKAKWLLLFVGIGFLGYYVSRLLTWSFQWYDILIIPAYVLFTIVNNAINRNNIIGQGDIDILNGSLALMVPVLIKICSEDYNMVMVNQIHVLGLVMDMLIWLFIGLVVVSIIVLIREAYIRLKYIMKPYFAYKKEEKLAKKTNKFVGASDNEVEQFDKDESIESDEQEIEVITEEDSQKADIKEESETGKKKKRLLKTKVPVALSFMPLYFFMVYMAIYY